MGQKRRMPLPGAGGTTRTAMAVRALLASGPSQAEGNDGGHGNRSGLQLVPVQRRAGGDDSEIVPVELLLAFARAMIHQCLSGDALYLALANATDKAQATPEQVKALKKAVFSEHAKYSVWPKGF